MPIDGEGQKPIEKKAEAPKVNAWFRELIANANKLGGQDSDKDSDEVEYSNDPLNEEELAQAAQLYREFVVQQVIKDDGRVMDPLRGERTEAGLLKGEKLSDFWKKRAELLDKVREVEDPEEKLFSFRDLHEAGFRLWLPDAKYINNYRNSELARDGIYPTATEQGHLRQNDDEESPVDKPEPPIDKGKE